jgi:hypothetical protein
MNKKILYATLLGISSFSYAMNGQEQPSESNTQPHRTSSPGLKAILSEGQQKFGSGDDKEYVETDGLSKPKSPEYQFGSPTWAQGANQQNQTMHNAFSFGLPTPLVQPQTQQPPRRRNSAKARLESELNAPLTNTELVILHKELKAQREQHAAESQEIRNQIATFEKRSIQDNATICAMLANLHWKVDHLLRVYYPKMVEQQPHLHQNSQPPQPLQPIQIHAHQPHPLQSYKEQPHKLRPNALPFYNQPKDDGKNGQSHQ